jgi:hypothetical protein
MKKTTHSESEIIKSVNELEVGIPTDEICRRLNISAQRFINEENIQKTSM